MGKRLPFSSKIVALAHEPIAYYMHKKGNFIQKITDFERNALREEEQVHENLIKRTIRQRTLKLKENFKNMRKKEPEE